MGFDFTMIAPLLPTHCGFSFVWMWGIFFGEFQCPPVGDCPAAICDSGVLARGNESTSFYSAILVQGPAFLSLLFWAEILPLQQDLNLHGVRSKPFWVQWTGGPERVAYEGLKHYVLILFFLLFIHSTHIY